MMSEIEDPKYYAPKMKCIPDVSHQKQMSAVSNIDWAVAPELTVN